MLRVALLLTFLAGCGFGKMPPGSTMPSGKPMPPLGPATGNHMRSIENGFRCLGERNGFREYTGAYCKSGHCQEYACVASCSAPNGSPVEGGGCDTWL